MYFELPEKGGHKQSLGGKDLPGPPVLTALTMTILNYEQGSYKMGRAKTPSPVPIQLPFLSQVTFKI